MFNYIIKNIIFSVIGIAIITYLLGLSVLPCCALTLFISIILMAFIMEKNNHFHDNLDLLMSMPIIEVSTWIVYTLIGLCITPEFNMNYPHLSETNIFILYTGTARITIGILLSKKDRFFDRIKKILYMVLPYLKKNPLFCLAIGIAAFLSIIIFSNICCWCLGVTPCTNSFFSFYIFILTKMILINSIISLFLLPFTKSSEEWYNIVGMSIWLPVTLIPSTLFYYYLILPELILIRLAFVDTMHIRVTRFEQDIVDYIEIILTHLKVKSSCLKPLFFFKYKKSR